MFQVTKIEGRSGNSFFTEFKLTVNQNIVQTQLPQMALANLRSGPYYFRYTVGASEEFIAGPYVASVDAEIPYSPPSVYL